nr:cyclin G [Leptinotarsa decemlineata]
MDQASKRRGRPLPDAINMKPIAFNLEDALAVETLYRPNLLVIQQDLKPWEVTLNSRDSSVQILRFFRVWFDVPQTIFYSAVTYLDLFLARMKVQEKCLSCVTISCFYIATLRENINIDVNQLVSISQSKCSVADMTRMAGIIKDKLKLENHNNGRLTTCADILLIFLDILNCIDSTFRQQLKDEQLLTRLEVLLADSNCAFFRSSTLALALLRLEIEKVMTQAIAVKKVYKIGEFIHLLAMIRDIQVKCKIKTTELVNCSSNASKVLKQYDNQDRTKHSQNLMWRFSSSTFSKGKRNRNYHLPLDTIQEKTLANNRFHKKMRTN